LNFKTKTDIHTLFFIKIQKRNSDLKTNKQVLKKYLKKNKKVK